jgi:hypothetical protein
VHRVKDSSNVYGLDWKDNNLDVTYKLNKNSDMPGETYRYFGVPEGIFILCLAARSKGEYLNTWVKQVGYRYEKLPQAHAIAKEVEKEESAEVDEVIKYLEEKGLVRTELDDNMVRRVVVTGDIAHEIINSFVSLPERMKKSKNALRRIVEGILRQNLDPIPKALAEYIRERKK